MTQLAAKRPSDSATEMVQVVLPNDANPLGFILGGTVMHLIDIAGAIACHRHTRSLLVTAAVDGLQFLHPIKVGDLIILRAQVTCVFSTSLEVEVEVFSEETLTGTRKLTSRAFLHDQLVAFCAELGDLAGWPDVAVSGKPHVTVVWQIDVVRFKERLFRALA